MRRDLFAQYGLPPDVIKGCLPYSGVYDFRDMVMYGQSGTGGPAENLFTQDSDKVDASPIAFLEGLQTPFFVTLVRERQRAVQSAVAAVRAGAA